MQKKLPFYLGLFFVMVFIIINIYLTQAVSANFFGIVYAAKENAAIAFLQKMKTHPDFSQQLSYFQTVYGSTIDKKVFSENQKRREKIKTAQMLLNKNPQSRDLLLVVSKLYLDEGDTKKALEYYKKARHIDPEVHINKLD